VGVKLITVGPDLLKGGRSGSRIACVTIRSKAKACTGRSMASKKVRGVLFAITCLSFRKARNKGRGLYWRLGW